MRHWTISRLKDFESCPAKYDYAHNKKVAGGIPSPAMDRGTEIHASCEQYLLNQTDELHKEIAPVWRYQLKHLRQIGAIPEQMWELSEGWYPRTGEDLLWWRGKIDAHFVYVTPARLVTKDKLSMGSVLNIIDFKTGKPYLNNMEQLEVYALAGFALFDTIDTIHASLWYLDSDEPHDKTFTRSQAPKLARKWEGRTRKLLEATEFPPRPGKQCSWCAFRKICPQAQTA